MKKIIIPVVLLTIAVGVFFIITPSNDVSPPVPAVTAPPPAEPIPTEPKIKYPVSEPAPKTEPPPAVVQPAPEPKTTPSLPGIAAADTVMRELLALLGNQNQLIELFHLDHFIQRFVVTLDNLPRKELAHRQLPVKGASGPFLVQGEIDKQVISHYNSRRYTQFVQLAETLDSRILVDIYVRNYPLFQKAYANLGYPEAYFNDRLVEVIDHLLDTPEAGKSIRLERPAVLYHFADPNLEARSAGQKILLRIGSDNAARIKNKLRELRKELMTQIRR